MKIVEADDKMKILKVNREIEKIKPKILKVLKKYKIKRAGIFGKSNA